MGVREGYRAGQDVSILVKTENVSSWGLQGLIDTSYSYVALNEGL